MGVRAAPEGLPMVAFSGDAQNRDIQKFVTKHGNAFLVLMSSMSQTKPGGVVEITKSMRVMVFPVVRLPTSTHEGVTVGRGLGNDIVVKDDTLSKHHATFTAIPNGLAVVDEGSTNGTAVDGMPVATRASGESTTMIPGQTLRCGTVTFTFVDAARLIDLCHVFRGSY